MPRSTQMSLYLSESNHQALEEVADALHGRLSPTARHLLLIGLKVERARLGLPEIDTTQATKYRADAEAQGVPTRGQRDAAAARAQRANREAPAPARIRPRRPSDAPLPQLPDRPISDGVWLPPDITHIDPI